MRFRSLFSACCFALCLLPLTASSQTAQQSSRMQQMVEGLVHENHFMGVVLVAEGDRVLLQKAYGEADLEWHTPHTLDGRFRIGSLTKQFTAASILLLVQQGKVHLDDPIRTYYADAPAAWDQVTIRRLLNHTAGVPNFTSLPDYSSTQRLPVTPQQLIARFRDKPLDFTPGTKMKYSNSGYALLGWAIEKASGMPYRDFVQKSIFAPLNMTETGYDDAATIVPRRVHGYALRDGKFRNADIIDMSIPYAAGGFYSTVGDLLKWERGLYDGKVLSLESLHMMLTPEAKQTYAFGISEHTVADHKRYDHDGGVDGFNADMIHYPEKQLSVIVLSNVEGITADRVADALGRFVMGENVILPFERKEVPITPLLLDEYAGTYTEADGTQDVIAVEDGHLVLTSGARKRPPLFAESETRFFSRTMDLQVEFHRDAGKVSSFTITLGGNQTTATRH